MAEISTFQLLFLSTIAIICILPFSEEYSRGAPNEACFSMLPQHGPIQPQASPPPYTIRTSKSRMIQGSGLDVSFSRLPGAVIIGFLMQARSVESPDHIVGYWSNLPPNTQTMDCNAPSNSITHSNSNFKDNLVFHWNAPDAFVGSVVFRATILKSGAVFWQNVKSNTVEIFAPSAILPPVTSAPATPAPVHKPETTTISTIKYDDIFYEGCERTKFCFGSSTDCLQNRICDSAVAVLVQNETYTFELLGNGNLKYISVALSADRYMGDDTSMECVKSNGKISAHTSWINMNNNYPYITRDNVSQNTIRLLSSSHESGRIYCRFTRDVHTTVRHVKFDLSKDMYFVVLFSGNELDGTRPVILKDHIYAVSDQKLSLWIVINQLAEASRLLLKDMLAETRKSIMSETLT